MVITIGIVTIIAMCDVI